MKKLIFKFWIVNVLIAVVLFIIYRIVISESEAETDTFFEKFMFILNILLNLGYSLIYVIGMLISSLLFFLNLFKKIRNNFYLSMLTFLGIPMAGIIYIFWIMYMISDLSGDHSINFLTTFLIFSFVYFGFNLMQFLIFRKRIKIAVI